MPYNVIALSSTVIAVFFGVIYNSMIRKKSEILEELKEENKKKPITQAIKSVEKQIHEIIE